MSRAPRPCRHPAGSPRGSLCYEPPVFLPLDVGCFRTLPVRRSGRSQSVRCGWAWRFHRWHASRVGHAGEDVVLCTVPCRSKPFGYPIRAMSGSRCTSSTERSTFRSRCSFPSGGGLRRGPREPARPLAKLAWRRDRREAPAARIRQRWAPQPADVIGRAAARPARRGAACRAPA